jgi:hypothetical protein
MTQQQVATRNQQWSIYPATVDEARAFIKRQTSMTEAADAAQLILSSYPQNVNPVNAECYATQVVALLATYPPEVVHQLSTPTKGIVRKCKWLPSVQEIAEEADRLMYIPRQMVERRDVELEQLRERKRLAEGKSSSERRYLAKPNTDRLGDGLSIGELAHSVSSTLKWKGQKE